MSAARGCSMEIAPTFAAAVWRNALWIRRVPLGGETAHADVVTPRQSGRRAADPLPSRHTSTTPIESLSPNGARPHRVDRGRRPQDPRVADRFAIELRYAGDRVRLRGGVPGVSETRSPGLPDPGRGAPGPQRTGGPEPDRGRASSAHRVHHRTRG